MPLLVVRALAQIVSVETVNVICDFGIGLSPNQLEALLPKFHITISWLSTAQFMYALVLASEASRFTASVTVMISNSLGSR